jgi:hypothetical protein
MKELVKPLKSGKEDQLVEALFECGVCKGDNVCSGDTICDYYSSTDSSDDILF